MKTFFRILIYLPAIIPLVITCQTSRNIQETEIPQEAPFAEKTECPQSDEEFRKTLTLHEFDDVRDRKILRAQHYPVSNERRIDLFYPFLKDIGGGYIGVGTDQNFTFIAWAKSEYAYLVDFDWLAVYVNRLHLLFFEESNSFEEFRKYWSKTNYHTTLKFIQNKIPDPAEFELYRKSFTYSLPFLTERFRDYHYMTEQFGFHSFHNVEEYFFYIKKLVHKKRIQAYPGDINGTVTLRGIGEASRKLCIPVRVIYLSNAEEYYRYPETFRDNIRNLYFDDRSIIIRTVTAGAKTFGYPDGEKFPEIPFHYNIQPVANLLLWFQEEKLWIKTMLQNRTPVKKGLSLLEKTPGEIP